MRVSLDTGAITSLDQNRGIGVYAEQLKQRLPKFVEIISDRPDLIHSLVFKLFSLRPWPKGAPVVVTIHDLIPLKYPKAYPPGIRGRLKWWWQRRQLKQAAAIITDSNASRHDIAKFTGINPDKIWVVYLAADEIYKQTRVENKYQLPKKFVLYVGDLNWNKNVVSLTKICLKLGYPLVVVGRQAVETGYDYAHPETTELVKFQHLAKVYSNGIIRLGVVPPNDLVGIYNLATVYVQPSRDEGFGLPVLEAMACGCPVLSSVAGSLPEITGKAALIFNRANLKQVWQNKNLRQRLSQPGLVQAKKFSWQKTVRETVEVYEKIIADRAHR